MSGLFLTAPLPGRSRGFRSGEAAFTLIELTVALVAGLAVVLGLMALSREASRTFNEEVRSTASEASLRTANDRLRADLARAGFMSTGNIQTDPTVCLPLGKTIATVNPRPPQGILSLQAIQVTNGGSAGATPLSGNQSPALNPASILIAGNMTTAEQLPILSQAPVPGGTCTRIMLSPVSPALYRIAPQSSQNQALDLANAFQPVPGKQFLVRLVDDTGAAQYLETCNELSAAGFMGGSSGGSSGSSSGSSGGGAAGAPYVDIQPLQATINGSGIYAPADTGTKCGVAPISSGHVFINPVQVVRWEIVQASVAETANTAQYSNALGGLSTASTTVDPNKYDLVRSYVDITTPTLPDLYASTEIIAEYAIDLDFAFTVDSGTAYAPNVTTYAFEDPLNFPWVQSVAQNAAAQPQRLREVRYRIVTRTAMADRSVNVAVASPSQYGAELYLYRYCLSLTGCTANGTLQWARARTITGEVSLPNLQSDYF